MKLFDRKSRRKIAVWAITLSSIVTLYGMYTGDTELVKVGLESMMWVSGFYIAGDSFRKSDSNV